MSMFVGDRQLESTSAWVAADSVVRCLSLLFWRRRCDLRRPESGTEIDSLIAGVGSGEGIGGITLTAV
jgi:hypothetical protein